MRRNKHDPKVPIITGIILFVIISVVVINAHDMKTISRVKVSNQSIVISQGDTGLSNTDLNFNNTGSLNNQGIDGNNVGVNIGNNGNINNAGGSFNNTGGFNNMNTNFNNSGDFNNTGGNFNNAGGNFNNVGGNFNNQNGNFNNNGEFGDYNVGFGNKDYQSESNRYKYQAIDWGTWKSNFVNRILDDSQYIRSLDTYGIGTWFYYSFNVTDKGDIKDVTVFSLYLSAEDKKQVRNLIRQYAHKPITIFPKDSKRKQAKVKAIMILGDSESKSDASNFRDIEKIKIQY